MPDVIYKCSMCKQQFTDEHAAINCENSHNIATDFTVTDIDYQRNNDMGFPGRLEIKINGNDTVVGHYHLDIAFPRRYIE